MPNYAYEHKCYLDPITRNVPIDERDKQTCDHCGELLTRKWVFEGSVWAPSAGGMR